MHLTSATKSVPSQLFISHVAFLFGANGAFDLYLLTLSNGPYLFIKKKQKKEKKKINVTP